MSQNTRIIPLISTKEYLTEQTIDRLKNMGLKTIQLSIDSSLPKIADFMAGTKGYFKEMDVVISSLTKKEIEISTNTVITPHNVHHIPDLIDYLVSKNVKSIRLSQYSRSIYKHKDEFFLSLEEANWLREKVEEKKRKYLDIQIQYPLYFSTLSFEERMENFLNRGYCSGGKLGFVILPDGKVILCEQLPTTDDFIIGDLSKQSIQEIWDSPKLKELIYPKKELFEGTECGRCENFDHCILNIGRCIRDIQKVYGNIYSVDPNCPKVKSPVRLF